MTIEIKQRLLPDGRPNKPSRSMKPQYITIHNTDNSAPGATAESHSRYILNGSGGREASWHYTVDDKEIYQHLRDDEQGWHAGTNAGNTTSIGIEVCMYQGMDEPKAWQRAAELIALLCKRHGIPVSRVVPHKHWSGKACPSRILPRWSEFVKMIEKELGALEKPKQPDYAGHWAEASIRRVMDAGIMNGRGNGFAPNEPITRAEMAVVADRLLKQMGK
ncbi:N-acetylmuramoyl-L-alanine amidase [Paenibacillus melissococcoides]|uniref:N-acetylmuramoyl-L-alanine amidase n=2 Tax=Paenibacillus TaxID=44249 RepID=A0ABM9GAB5_9BACL|nr:N-acetylmuramoyl-L-alanine amidase [Paenibacillus melissococcoides]MEB9896737.1 N-acetylmuramoyl-L-alanine amidase [Bacillus cereus]CAH8247444.1 N-acetylmuramoyl-L-alanine amidase [Paenibacillus melissococcoides]CAH8249039.1 N-acetylmuramoyl-L-alanine amidase [Paenibacillus melissococcoides]CAH8705126.1 N-acetylmuramoyl-L-alanine amidase [Paenibacillus melissococcoides]CAH8708349.1 N-acetylmuramoyl-L-alanine amidase [Paenibacillus melissococcoides]